MASKTKPIARPRPTKQEAEHSEWLMGKLFEVIKIRKELRRRRHKLPEALMVTMERLEEEMTMEFIRLLTVKR